MNANGGDDKRKSMLGGSDVVHGMLVLDAYRVMPPDPSSSSPLPAYSSPTQTAVTVVSSSTNATIMGRRMFLLELKGVDNETVLCAQVADPSNIIMQASQTDADIMQFSAKSFFMTRARMLIDRYNANVLSSGTYSMPVYAVNMEQQS